MLKEGSKDQSGRTIGLPIEQAMQKFLQDRVYQRAAESGPDEEGSIDQCPVPRPAPGECR